MIQKPIVVKQAIRRIFFSVLIISGIPWAIFGIFISIKYLRLEDPAYSIVALIQSHNETEPLKTEFLSELLDLSIDRPTNLYRFNIEDSKKKLLNFPLIKQASISKIPPGILFVAYSLRKPIAFLGEATNTVVDNESIAFPFYPFFSPKELPIFHLGSSLESIRWGKRVSDNKLTLAFEVLEELSALKLFNNNFIKIDVSHVNAKSLGLRKIVISFSENHDILLDPVNYKEGLLRYRTLINANHSFSMVSMVDLRLSQLGYITKDSPL